MSTAALSASGKVFFSSLCVGTFGLGVWQSQRYFEKEKLMEERIQRLQEEPRKTFRVASTLEQKQERKFRRHVLSGTYVHDGEVLVGPRTLPAGTLPKGKQQGVMGGGEMTSGPAGYFVVTPFRLSAKEEDESAASVVLVNRGWIPKDFVDKTSNTRGLWERPTGPVEVLAIPTETEQPKYVAKQANASAFMKSRPWILFYFDKESLLELLSLVTGTKFAEPSIVTQIRDTDGSANKTKIKFPLQPPPDKIGEYTISPAVHAGYAATWYGLSAAGLYMTRKLLLRGRG